MFDRKEYNKRYYYGQYKNGKNVKKKCLSCGKEFFVFPSRVKKGGGKFCSRKCVGKEVNKNHNYEVIKRCKTCGKEFYTYRYRTKNGRGGKFCSASCRSIWTVKHNRKKNTQIEIKVREMLKKLGIKFESQKIIPEGKTIADFYIPEQRLVLYADGKYWHSLPEVKNRDGNQDFLLAFNGYKVLRLGGDEINFKPIKCLNKIKKYLKKKGGVKWKQ